MAEHRNLTGASLHEPKGAATATAGQVYIADGAGSGTWQSTITEAGHANISDPNLHEPKGASTAADGAIYIADGAGSGTWSTAPTNQHGWANYTDTAAAQTFGTTDARLNNNKGTLIETYLPKEIRGSGTLWASNKLTPIAVGDAYVIRLTLPVTAKTGSPNKIFVSMDIGNTGAITNLIDVREFGVTGTPPYNLNFTTTVFSLSTFKANGMQIFVKTDTGTVDILDPQIFITRVSAG